MIAFFVAVGIHPSAAISLPLFMIINPNLNWRYLLIAPFMFAIAHVVSNVFFGSSLARIYASASVTGDYYLIVTGAALAVALFFKDRELIMCAIFGFISAIMISEFGNYVLNRLIVFFYIPFLFAPIRERYMKMQIHTLVTILMCSILFAAAFQVKLREPGNRFIPYETIVLLSPRGNSYAAAPPDIVQGAFQIQT